jgi:hypothetical protein
MPDLDLIKQVEQGVRDRRGRFALPGQPVSTAARPASHSEKGGEAAGGSCLRLVTGRRPIGGALAPVAGAVGQPFEGGVSGNVFENPREIVGVIGRHAQLGIVGHDFR